MNHDTGNGNPMDAMDAMLDCESVMRQLWDFLDQQLTPETMQAIEQHLDECHRCRPQAEFRRAFERAVSSAREEAGNTDALRDRIRLALHSADRPTG